MPLMPLMPTGDPMQSPSPGPPSGEGMPPGGGDQSGLLAMLGGAQAGDMGSNMTAGASVPSQDQMGMSSDAQMMQVVQQIMAQFQQLEQMVMDLAGMLPGTEQVAEAILQDFDLWKKQAVMTMAPQPQAQPGASQMM
jgi:hypothetical protein